MANHHPALNRLWNLLFHRDIPETLEQPIDALWAVTFGAGKAPADALKRLAAAHGIAYQEEAPAPKATAKARTKDAAPAAPDAPAP